MLSRTSSRSEHRTDRTGATVSPRHSGRAPLRVDLRRGSIRPAHDPRAKRIVFALRDCPVRERALQIRQLLTLGNRRRPLHPHVGGAAATAKQRQRNNAGGHKNPDVHAYGLLAAHWTLLMSFAFCDW